MPASPDLLPDAVVRYGEHAEAVVDLHLPAQPNGTLVVLVHGGFWHQQFDRTHTRDQARDLADRGYLVATPEYRRVGGGGGWPVTPNDLEDAVQALPDLLAGLGLGRRRTVLIGHSAGGHLVLWLATRPLRPAPEQILALAPVCDLVAAAQAEPAASAVRAFLGGAPVAAADPMTLLAATRPATSPEVVLIHGTEDGPVPIGLSRGFAARHSWARLIELPRTDHFEFVDPASSAWAVVVETLSAGDPMREDEQR